MKHQLLDIYQTYHDMPHLLADTTVKESYLSLLSVKTLDEFKQWRKLVAVLGLSFTDTDSVKRRDNMIGWLDDLAGGEGDSLIADFLTWKNLFTADGWYQKIVDNENDVNRIMGEVTRDYDVHIVLFRCGKHWAAIGNDADRLFEIFGWQTGSVFDGVKDVSFMYVTACGKIVIDASEYSVKYLDFGEIDIFSSSFNEDIVSAYQQQIDCARVIQDQSNWIDGVLSYNLTFSAPNRACKELAKAQVYITRNENGGLAKVTAKLEDGRTVVLAEGNSWRLDELGIPIFHALSTKIGKA